MEKATIQSDEAKITIKCLFNPETYTYTKAPQWKPQPPKGQNVGGLTFATGGSATLALHILLDGTEDGTDVRKTCNDLVKLVSVDPTIKEKGTHSQGRPPKCKFIWGDFFSFEAAITSLKLVFELFTDDSKCLRATADVTFTQLTDEKVFAKQNPTSGGVTGERLHRLGPRETLELVAWSEFGDADLWRPLAAFNGIDDPLRMRAGDTILLPASRDALEAFD
jgi:hypothetical protein